MTTDKLKVALVEFSPEWEKPEANMKALDGVIAGLFSGSVPDRPDMVVLPEFFSAGFTMNPEAAEPEETSATYAWMEKTALKYGCAVTGSVPVADCGSRRYNRLFFTAPAGSWDIICKEHYDKSHLFFGGEQENYVPGKERKVFEYKGWKILPGICFDLRFPEWSRNTASGPYDLYLNVANWPVARNAAAEILLKARSIENACWSVFCNRTGSDPLLDYSGNSAIIDFRGRSRGERFTVAGVPVVYGVLEKPPMLRFRKGFPVLDLAPDM